MSQISFSVVVSGVSVAAPSFGEIYAHAFAIAAQIKWLIGDGASIDVS